MRRCPPPRTLYLIERGPKPECHKAPFHPVILCASRAVAQWEAGATDKLANVWVKYADPSSGWLLVRWHGLDIDYGHIVRRMPLPDGTTAAISHDRNAGPWKLLRSAVWWSTRRWPDLAFRNRRPSRGRVLATADRRRRGLLRSERRPLPLQAEEAVVSDSTYQPPVCTCREVTARPCPVCLARMPRPIAARYFQTRLDDLKERIRALPTAEKLRLAADMLETDGVTPDMPRSVLRLALAEIERGGM
jgi:hypothetical protein